jgi:peptidyl-prolyl cis-trans isomerase SurA
MRVKPMTKPLLGLLLAATLIGAAACGGDGDEQASEGGSSSQSAPADGAADLEGVPDVVAEVNDEEISKDEFAETYELQLQQASAQAQQTGQPVDQEQLKQQVAETMVGTELLRQEAERRGFEATDADVDKALTDLARQNGMKSPAQFLAAMKQQGLAEDDVRDELTTQVGIEQLLTKEGGDAEPTEAELRALYDRAKKQQQASGQQGQLPPFAKVRAQLVEQAQSDKQNAVAERLVTSLRKAGDVTINL